MTIDMRKIIVTKREYVQEIWSTLAWWPAAANDQKDQQIEKNNYIH